MSHPVPSSQPDTRAYLYFGLFGLHPVQTDRDNLYNIALRSVVPTVVVLALGVILSQKGLAGPLQIAASASVPVLMAAMTLGWVVWLFRRFPEGRAAPFDLALPIAVAAFTASCGDFAIHALTQSLPSSVLTMGGHMLVVWLLWTGVGIAATSVILFISTFGPNAGAATRAPGFRRLNIAGRDIARDTLVMLEANGNSVVMVTVHGRDTLPGPLADRIAELPAGLGKLIHRSVWVSADAVEGYTRKGRDVVVELAGGNRAVAASSRHAEVLPWLRDLMEERETAA